MVYHPQTDGLVQHFNRTLTDMLAKTVEKNSRNWDSQIPYVLFTCRSSPQESTCESPFFLLYGRDPQMNHSPRPHHVPLMLLMTVKQNTQEAWDSAREKHRKDIRSFTIDPPGYLHSELVKGFSYM